MNKDSNILAEKYEAINENKRGSSNAGENFFRLAKSKDNPFKKDDKVEDVDYIDVDSKVEQEPGLRDKAKAFAKKAALKSGEIAKKSGELAKKGAKEGIRAAGRTYGAYKVGKDYFDKRSKASSDAKNASRLYAAEFLKGEQSYQDLNNRYGIDDAQMYDILKKARIPVTAFGMYRGKAGRGVDVYNDYINKYKPAPIQKLGRGIKSFANYFRGKKKPEA